MVKIKYLFAHRAGKRGVRGAILIFLLHNPSHNPLYWDFLSLFVILFYDPRMVFIDVIFVDVAVSRTWRGVY